jgi:ADP-ribosylglycohydrolase
MLRAASTVELRSKFRGCVLGAIVGDCMGGRFDGAIEPFALISSRTEPASLRNQLPRTGAQVLFPYGSDTLMMNAVARVVLDSTRISGTPSVDSDPYGLESDLLTSLQTILKRKVHESSSVDWGAGTRNFLESPTDVTHQLRSNCGVTRSLISGLIDVNLARPVCAVTHKHTSAIEGAHLVAGAVQSAIHDNAVITESDIAHPEYHRIVRMARVLASGEKFSEMNDFDTKLQEAFFSKFGCDASAKCAVAGAVFAVHRTIHSLPHVDASSEAYQSRIAQVTQHGLKKSKSKLSVNLLGNSNRMDSSSLYSKLTPSIEQDLPVALAVNWAISLGGDSRSLGFLSGGLAGALWGERAIPEEWLLFSEGIREGRELADELFDRFAKTM